MRSLRKLTSFLIRGIYVLNNGPFKKFKIWDAADIVLCRDIVPMGGPAGQLGQYRDCPAKIGTIDMSVQCSFRLVHMTTKSLLTRIFFSRVQRF